MRVHTLECQRHVGAAALREGSCGRAALHVKQFSECVPAKVCQISSCLLCRGNGRVRTNLTHGDERDGFIRRTFHKELNL